MAIRRCTLASLAAVAVAAAVVATTAAAPAGAPVPDGSLLDGKPPADVHSQLTAFASECASHRSSCYSGAAGAVVNPAACERCVTYCFALVVVAAEHEDTDALDVAVAGQLDCQERLEDGGGGMQPTPPPTPTPELTSTPAPAPTASATPNGARSAS